MTAPTALAAGAIFLATYAVVALGKLPGWRIDRAGAALLGAGLTVAAGVLTLDEAYRAIDFDTIALLLGMMIVVAHLRLSGFFRLVTAWTARRARRPLLLLVAIVALCGVLSAFLVNDTVCLVMTPLVLDIVERLRRDPVPYLVAVAAASNVGSTATITGNPQNMIVGGLSGIPYGAFAAALAPVAAVGLVLTACLVALLFRREFLTGERLAASPSPARWHGGTVLLSVAAVVGIVACFFLGQPVAKVAVCGGGLLLLLGRVRPEKIYREVDWPLLVMFAGLFIVVAGLERAVLTPDAAAAIGALHLDRLPVLAAVTAALSNLVSNVPAVLALKPLVEPLPDPARAWLCVAAVSTLAGNLTLVGSVANLIVVQRARARGVEIGFGTWFRLGAPLTLLTILAALARLGAF
jgi:Na+/H+ antiporter NhaD/arsenite permease-like protein